MFIGDSSLSKVLLIATKINRGRRRGVGMGGCLYCGNVIIQAPGMMHDETKSIHSGCEYDANSRAVATPIYQTVSYEFDSARHGAELFAHTASGHSYTRISNPTTSVLEARLADLEGGVGALCVGSGSAAITYAVQCLARSGTNIVSTPQLYGGTHALFAQVLPLQGIEVRFSKDDHPDSIASLIDERTRAVYTESIGNPAANITDIEAVADVAHCGGIPLIVDNTVATPILLKPIRYGADVVVHSLTKYIAGHGNSIGGVIIDSGRFPWFEHPDRFSQFALEPEGDRSVHQQAAKPAPYIAHARTFLLRNTGAVISPFNAFLILQGMETLALRMERHCENALAVSRYLEEHSGVETVNFAGLASSPFHTLANKYVGGMPASLLSFEIRGGYEAAVRFYDNLKLIKRMVSIGETRSLACHPASTTHEQMSPRQQRLAGVTPGLIRLSVGIEHIDDILADIDQALCTC